MEDTYTKDVFSNRELILASKFGNGDMTLNSIFFQHGYVAFKTTKKWQNISR
jgi:hypothetical protein